ncbi:MAG: hypothetical protein ACI4TR_06485 [Bacteroidaceae bacterium]
MKIKCYLKAAGGFMQSEDLSYPAVVDAGRIDGEAFVDSMEVNNKVPRGQALAVLNGVSVELLRFLELGHSVEVPGLGVFSLDVKGKVATNENGNKKVADGKAVINFMPKSVLRRGVESADFEIVNENVAPSRSLSNEEAMAVAEKLCDEMGFFMQRHFAEAACVSQSYASRLLGGLVKNGKLTCERTGRIIVYKLSTPAKR